ncbi:MAG: polyprenol monophosphomannose synthase [Nitrospirae bacterium]|nr:polyprenol monophosphomannose synthase [Nitrospirota bacterium]
MLNSHPASPPSNDTEQITVRYYPVSNSCGTSASRELGVGEAFVVPSFELAEALIARGADSARVAISQIDSADANYPGYVQVASNKQLVPLAPFRFDRSILIVLPTYNERQNLATLIEAIGRYLVADILIVDDNSPDGTGQLANQLSREQKHVHVLHRPRKEGLGPAYLAGFQWALARSYQSIIEMDCDFSHAPWDLPRLVHRSSTADLVIGSRYVRGGGTQNWNARRRLVSKCGNTYVSLFLGSSIRDWTGGFRCYRHELLAKIDLETVKAKGYVFQVEMAWRACQLGAEICELPIRFSDRIEGQSKLGWQSIVEAVTEVPRMYFKKTTCR